MDNWSLLVGQAIFNRRLDLDWSIATLARKSKLSRRTIYNMENGILGPRGHNLFKVAQALRCSMDSLYIGVSEEISSSVGIEQ